MNEIKVIVNFKNRKIDTIGTDLTCGDYNSTKLVFNFDKEDGMKIFEMRNPSGQTVLIQEITNNELILANFDEDGQASSIFNQEGTYIFEISLYEDNSKLTSAASYLKVKLEQIVVGDEVIETYLPIFDELINRLQDSLGQVNNIDIDVSKTDNISTVTVTNKDSFTKIVQILDGEKGNDGNDYIITQQDYRNIADIVEDNIQIPTNNNQLINGAGYITGITSNDVTSALGYTPYNSTNPNGYTANTGTITGITMNGTSKGTSGIVNLGTVLTSHQDISDKENISNKITSITSTSTDIEYPSAKAVYTLFNSITNADGISY